MMYIKNWKRTLAGTQLLEFYQIIDLSQWILKLNICCNQVKRKKVVKWRFDSFTVDFLPFWFHGNRNCLFVLHLYPTVPHCIPITSFWDTDYIKKRYLHFKWDFFVKIGSHTHGHNIQTTFVFCGWSFSWSFHFLQFRP